MPNNKSSNEQLLGEIQQFLLLAVHDLRAAQRRTSIAGELLGQAIDAHERNEFEAQISLGQLKTEELLAGIASYAIVLTPNRYEITTFPAGRAVRFAIANLDGRIREAGATVNVADLPEISADRDRIAELFEHLIANSLRFQGADAPVIDIEAKGTLEGWVFSVKDNGMGIPPKYRDRLFIPFRRLQGPETPGAGLGLAISRKIVEAHGGRIWIDPWEGPGVMFCFVLSAAHGD